MPLVLIDGPEKAGKSTLIRWLHYQLGARVREWGPVASHKNYEQPVIEAVTSTELTVWGRGWPSEAVYSTLLDRPSALANDAWLGEWAYGRALKSWGMGIILAGPAPSVLASRRTPDDLPVDPAVEQAAYVEYGRRFGYTVLAEAATYEALDGVLAMISRIPRTPPPCLPPTIAGPLSAGVIVIGEARNMRYGEHALPFMSPYTTLVGRQLGDLALDCLWANASDCPPDLLKGRVVVACGSDAQALAKRHTHAITDLIRIKHPSWLYRYNTAATQGAREEATEALSLVRRLLASAREKQEVTISSAGTRTSHHEGSPNEQATNNQGDTP